MFPFVLEAGVPVEEYWNLTLREIYDVLDAFEQKRKQTALDIFALADAISSRVGYILNDPKKRHESDILRPWDLYPYLFEEEKAKYEQREITTAMERRKVDMERRIEELNRRRK
jgi:hypothetical protein